VNTAEHELIAVAGVSRDASKYGHRIFCGLIKAGYSVKGVNINGGSVLGHNLYKSLDELEQKPDLVIAVVPPQAAVEIIEQCGRLGIKTVWLQPGSESGEGLEKARRCGVKTISACFMAQKGLW